MTLDLDRLRADTPGVEHRVHLNNAGAALMPRPVLDAIKEHLDLEARIGGYEAAEAREEEIGAAYEAVAGLVSGHPSNIAFTENATASFVQALSSIPFKAGDVLATTRNDYVSNQLQYLSLRERLGIEVVHAPDAPEGGLDPVAMEELIHRRRPRLVAVTHVPTSSGLVQRVADVGEQCRRREIPFLVDACQSVGQMPLDVEALGCDFLSGTARKFLRGPRGAGFLWVSDRILDAGLEPMFIDLRGADWISEDLYQPAPDARRFENWEFAWALVLGTGAAARYALDLGVEAIRERAWGLAARVREGLEALPGVTVLDRGEELSAIVSCAVAGRDPVEIRDRLRERGINTTAQGRTDALIDLDAKGVEGTLRVSPHYYNTEGEVEGFLEVMGEVVEA